MTKDYLILVALGIYFVLFRIIREIVALSLYLQRNWSNILADIEGLQESFDFLKEALPVQVVSIINDFEMRLYTSIRDFGSNLLASTLSITTSATTKAGNFFVKFITFFLALFFIVKDYDGINRWILKRTNRSFLRGFMLLRTSISTAIGGYLRALLILAFVCFLYMFAGFTIYGQNYAFLISLGLGFIDFLPVIGAIAILLPWGIFEILVGSFNKGIFILFLGSSFFVVRKIIEPKVMGSQTGLNPLIALIVTYTGLKIYGVWGAVFAPVFTVLLLCILRSGLFDDTIADVKDFFFIISNILKREKSKKKDSRGVKYE